MIDEANALHNLTITMSINKKKMFTTRCSLYMFSSIAGYHYLLLKDGFSIDKIKLHNNIHFLLKSRIFIEKDGFILIYGRYFTNIMLRRDKGILISSKNSNSYVSLALDKGEHDVICSYLGKYFTIVEKESNITIIYNLPFFFPSFPNKISNDNIINVDWDFDNLNYDFEEATKQETEESLKDIARLRDLIFKKSLLVKDRFTALLKLFGFDSLDDIDNETLEEYHRFTRFIRTMTVTQLSKVNDQLKTIIETSDKYVNDFFITFNDYIGKLNEEIHKYGDKELKKSLLYIVATLNILHKVNPSDIDLELRIFFYFLSESALLSSYIKNLNDISKAECFLFIYLSTVIDMFHYDVSSSLIDTLFMLTSNELYNDLKINGITSFDENIYVLLKSGDIASFIDLLTRIILILFSSRNPMCFLSIFMLTLIVSNKDKAFSEEKPSELIDTLLKNPLITHEIISSISIIDKVEEQFKKIFK